MSKISLSTAELRNVRAALGYIGDNVDVASNIVDDEGEACNWAYMQRALAKFNTLWTAGRPNDVDREVEEEDVEDTEEGQLKVAE